MRGGELGRERRRLLMRREGGLRTWYDDFSSGVLSPYYQNVGNTWAVGDVGGGVPGLVNVPEKGASALVNGDMETGDPPTGWTALGSAILDGVADERTGGSGAQSLSVTRGTANSSVSKSFPATVGAWYRPSCWQKVVTSTGIAPRIIDLWVPDYSTDTNWNEIFGIFRAPTDTLTMLLYVLTAGTVGRFDDILIPPFITNTLFLTLRMASPKGLAEVGLTRAAKIVSGTVACLNDPANPLHYLHAYENGAGTAYLYQVLNGTPTLLVSGAVSYVAKTKLIIDTSALPTVALKYGAATVGTNTCTAEEIVHNKHHGAFLTGSGAAEGSIDSISAVCS